MHLLLSEDANRSMVCGPQRLSIASNTDWFRVQSARSRYHDKRSASSFRFRDSHSAVASTLWSKHSFQIALAIADNSGTGPPPLFKLATAAVLSRTKVTRAFAM